MKPLVDCKKCVWGGSVVSNFMIDCFNKVRTRMVLKSHTAQMDALATIIRRNNHDTGKEARRPK